jgi:hypothetical protein
MLWRPGVSALPHVHVPCASSGRRVLTPLLSLRITLDRVTTAMPRATTDFATVVLWVILACLAHVAVDVLVLLYRRRSRISRGRADAALDYADMAVPVPCRPYLGR